MQGKVPHIYIRNIKNKEFFSLRSGEHFFKATPPLAMGFFSQILPAAACSGQSPGWEAQTPKVFLEVVKALPNPSPKQLRVSTQPLLWEREAGRPII